ncbi:MAG TPA: winged helix-turn-helix domain-containing protein [Steroidobacteraceae bacterium]|jgi:predicted ATPase/DNA-binding winged helix-turn-helix (wHTH) protein|nr:winged helix-turn-helix domain-containing protein [Steroidobacteraceae bacterium]
MNEDPVYAFGSFKFVPRHQLLLQEGRQVKLGSRAMDILHLLVKNSGEPVSKRALQKFTWPDTFVHESNLKVHIHSLRRALGDTSPQSIYISTVPGRGYRFIQPVSIEPITQTELSRESPPPIHSLPAPRALVGRGSEIARIAGLLGAQRVVTLVGPGGVGKTAVAVAVAYQLHRKFPEGTYFLDLSKTNDSSVVPHILATACDIRGHPGDLVAAVASHLAKRSVLILIDSCEHVLAAVASLVIRLQETGVEACVLSTSLEPLRVDGEAVQLIEPLKYPAARSVRALVDALRYSAIELFAARASEWTDYQLSDHDVVALATLSEKLGGLPLAIELAAAKLDQYSPASLLESLDQRLSLLRNEDPTAHHRHRTLWATLDWSYRLLSVHEAMIFGLVSLFAGYFRQEDVVVMAQVVGYGAYQTTVALGGLVAKSFITAEVDDDSMRYRLLDVARVYATERLDQEPIAYEARHHFARFVLTTVKRFGQDRASRFLAAPEVAQYKRRLDDLRDALGWCFGAGDAAALGIEITGASIALWDQFSLIAEQQAQVDRALNHSGSSGCPASQLVPLAMSKAWSLTHRRISDEARDTWLLAVRLTEEANDINLRLRALWGRALYLIVSANYNEALECLSEYRQIAQTHENGLALPDGERLIAMAEVYLGKLSDARDKLEELWRGLTKGEARSGVPRYQIEPYVVIQNHRPMVAWLMGRPDQAAVMVEEAVDYIGRAGHTQAQSYVLLTGAIPISLWNGDFEAFERYTEHLGANIASDVTSWTPGYRFFRALNRHLRNKDDALHEMRTAIDDIRSSGFHSNLPMYLGMLASAHLQQGSLVEAERAVEEALALQARTHEGYSLPDLMRAQAMVLGARGRQDLAEAKLGDALEKCVQMSALSLKLRVACDLAELWAAQGRYNKVLELLAPIYGAFSEGYATKDLVRASALIAATRRTVNCG